MFHFDCNYGIQSVEANIHQYQETIELLGEGLRTISSLRIRSGDSIISIRFPSPDDLINFCKTHNIPLRDERNENPGEPT